MCHPVGIAVEGWHLHRDVRSSAGSGATDGPIIRGPKRAWCNGCTRPFQGLGAGSSPVARSDLGCGSDARQHSAMRALPAGGAASMAVRAHHVSLRDLLMDRLPAPIRQRLADVEALGIRFEVIELEHDRIAFAAIGASTASSKRRRLFHANKCSHSHRTKTGVESRRHRGVAQFGSAFGWGPKGRWFKSSRPD